MSLQITRAGILDTVQDSGRYSYQHLGINPGGAMDRFAAALANALLGKPLTAPVVEIHFPGPNLLFTKDAIACLSGADFQPLVNGEAVPVHQPFAIRAGSSLSFAGHRTGARCYLSLLNTLHLLPWLKSFSTHLRAGAGGHAGRPLQRGDEIDFDEMAVRLHRASQPLSWQYRAPNAGHNKVGFIPGPEWHWLDTYNQTLFLNKVFRITPAADRMGYRLQGVPLESTRKEQLISSAVTFGTVQLLPNGQLILLMADHQTTGGYPRLAGVMRAHLPLLAQMNPGDGFRLAITTVEEAEAKWKRQQQALVELQRTCREKINNWLHANRY